MSNKKREPHNKLRIEIGDTFNFLTIVEETEYFTSSGVSKRAFICRCVCGTEKKITLERLRRGQISCACKAIERLPDYKLRRTINHRYNGIKARCYNKNHGAFHNYGGRGIKMCDEWKNSFENFYQWCLSNGYSESLSIDRIDNNGDYCPDNCRFTTRKINSKNTRRSISLNIVYEILHGKYKNLSAYKISKELCVCRSTICRIRKRRDEYIF